MVLGFQVPSDVKKQTKKKSQGKKFLTGGLLAIRIQSDIQVTPERKWKAEGVILVGGCPSLTLDPALWRVQSRGLANHCLSALVLCCL